MDERSDVRRAIETLVGDGQPDWATAGVYCYWDRETHDVLYLGLTGDLRKRFAQHNGLIRYSGGNKWRQIQEYFKTKPRLGFSLLLQSKAVAVGERINEIDFTLGWDVGDALRVGEGQLIECHRLVHGRRPPWNDDPGARRGRRWASATPALLDLLAGKRDSLFAARLPLRELVVDLRSRFNESTIHASRMRAVMEANELAGLPQPSDSEELTQERIQKSLMLRSGHLVEDLDASDDTIRRWMPKLADPAFWAEQQAQWRTLMDSILDQQPDQKITEVLSYLDTVMADPIPPGHAEATQAMFDEGYLEREARIP